MTHHPLTNPPSVNSRFSGGKLVLVALLSVVYAAAYVVLRATHQIRCTSNAWNWHPEKWDLAHHFEVDAHLYPWSLVFKPLMLAEEMVRAGTAWLAHETSHWIVILAALTIAMIGGGLGVDWLCVRRWFSWNRGAR